MKAQKLVERLKANGWLYDYSKVVDTGYEDTVTIGCSKHGEFNRTVRTLLVNKYGCPECGQERLRQHGVSRRNSISQFIANSRKVHGDRYDYSSSIYINSSTKVAIKCSIHGIFQQAPTNHVDLGQGCPKCNTGNGMGGYTSKYFENNSEEGKKPGILYVVDMLFGNDRFLKVGITAKSMELRFGRSEYKDAVVEPIFTKHLTLLEAFNLEQQLLKDLNDYRFYPNTTFSGYTECLKRCPEVIHHFAATLL